MFELVVVIVITSVIVITLLNRFLYYQEMAEKSVMEMTVMNMRSGLRLRIAELIMQDRMSEAGRLLQENPITWLGVAATELSWRTGGYAIRGSHSRKLVF